MPIQAQASVATADVARAISPSESWSEPWVYPSAHNSEHDLVFLILWAPNSKVQWWTTDREINGV